MTISAARLAANQANAQRSTGPKTAAGKAQSRLNAYKHGLTATVVPIADEAIVQTRLAGVRAMVQPESEYQFWLCDRIALTTVKLDRVAAIERQTRIDAAGRAESCWDEDQADEANRIGLGLARHPLRTVGQLRRTFAGCEWLRTRWSMLADAADQGEWTDDQKNLAHDLIGTPPEFRGTPPERTLDRQGRPVVPQPSAAEFARVQMAELDGRWEQVLASDEIAQLGAMADLDDLGNRDLNRLRRYERALLNDLKTAVAQSEGQAPNLAGPTPFLRSVPTHLISPPTEPEATAQNEPKPEPIVTVKNEPKAEPIATVKNEPKPEAISTIANEPKSIVPPWAPAGLDRLDPRLAAILEAGMPQQGDLDVDFCQALVAARLGHSPPITSGASRSARVD